MPLFGRKKKAAAPEAPAPQAGLAGAPSADEEGLRSLTAHRDYVLSLTESLPPFGMRLLDAVGLSLCEDLQAEWDSPAVDVAQVEGYAVNAAHVAHATPVKPVELPVDGVLGIGEQATGEMAEGSSVRCVAGAPIPRGANAVVPLAHVEGDGGEDVRVTLAVQPGQFVRERGSDVVEGETLLHRGDVLDPRMVGMLAGTGVERVMARPRPRVVVLAVGAELVEPGSRLRNPSDVYDANSYMLAAACRAEGAQVYRVGLYTQNADEVRDAITDQLIRADLIISTGGVSREDYDLVRQAVPGIGTTDFCEVAMEPGRSQGFGLIGDDKVPMIMLPGSPVGAYASYQAFARPVLRKLMGIEPAVPPTVRAITQSMLRSPRGRTELVRGAVREEAGGRRLVEPLLDEDAHQLGDLARANALIVVPAETEVIKAGEPVQVWQL